MAILQRMYTIGTSPLHLSACISSLYYYYYSDNNNNNNNNSRARRTSAQPRRPSVEPADADDH